DDLVEGHVREVADVDEVAVLLHRPVDLAADEGGVHVDVVLVLGGGGHEAGTARGQLAVAVVGHGHALRAADAVEGHAQVGDDLGEVERERRRRAGLPVASRAPPDVAGGEQDVVVLAEIDPGAHGHAGGVRLRAEPRRLQAAHYRLVVVRGVREDLVAARPVEVVDVEPVRTLGHHAVDGGVDVAEQRGGSARAERVRVAHAVLAGGGGGRGGSGRRHRGRGSGRGG